MAAVILLKFLNTGRIYDAYLERKEIIYCIFLRIHGLRFIADFVLVGEFTSYSTFIQHRDTVAHRGQRSIYFSKYKSF